MAGVVTVVQVRQVMLAGQNDLGQALRYGYASDSEHTRLMKVELSALKPVKLIDLSRYQCVPLSAAFIHIGHYHRHHHRRILLPLNV